MGGMCVGRSSALCSPSAPARSIGAARTVTLACIPMAATLQQLISWRDSLFEARLGGVRSLRDQNGEEVTFLSDAKLAAALAAADAAIAAYGRTPANTIQFKTSKGI